MSGDPRHMAVMQSTGISRLRGLRERLSQASLHEAEQGRDEAFEKRNATLCDMQSALDFWQGLLRHDFNPDLVHVAAQAMLHKEAEVQSATTAYTSADKRFLLARQDLSQARVARELATVLQEQAAKSLITARFEIQNREAEQAFLNRRVRG